jgi:hypothetical protein
VIIGIGHNMQVGKDTAAMALSRELGFIRRAFADPLKDLAFKADPVVSAGSRAVTVNYDVGHGRLSWAVKGLGWEGAKATYPEVRKFLQNLGLAAREVFGADFWVDTLLQSLSPNLNYVIPDVRFANEAEAIQNEGGYLIKITRPGRFGDGHPSETSLAEFEGWDFVYDNTGSIPELEAAVVGFVRERQQALQAALAEQFDGDLKS